MKTRSAAARASTWLRRHRLATATPSALAPRHSAAIYTLNPGNVPSPGHRKRPPHHNPTRRAEPDRI
ncbi:hypothetical protein ACKI1Q_27240 [Streptomyces galilaeus]|uniref:hypothetical protein n=1 Tax=Streptomyces galilaeus TaxID=33899 RepID=UPI0038F6A53C